MIEELTITDLGVIADATIELDPGLTVITGETGAGKTMVLSGLALILGRKADSSSLRPGAQLATAEGRLIPPPQHPVLKIAADAGALLDDDVLLVTRTVSRNGRSRAHLGGRSVPAGVLAEVGDQLVTVHGQSDQLRLRSSANQRSALDAYAGNAELLHEFAAQYRASKAAAAALANWDADAQARAAEVTSLERAVERIDALELLSGQDAELRNEAERLGNVEELRHAACSVRASLSTDEQSGTPGAIELLQAAQRSLMSATQFDVALAQWEEQLRGAGAQLSDLATEAATYLAGLEADPGRLDAVHQRRAQIAELTREYLPAGPPTDAASPDAAGSDDADRLLAFADRARSRLADLTAPGAGRQKLADEHRRSTDAAAGLAEDLTRSRSAAAKQMAQAVDAELAALAMGQASLQVEVRPGNGLSEHGADEVEFLLSAHAGAPARPLGKGASGGELSRVMLAVEVALAGAGKDANLPTFVFDEVDAGVGGRAATEVGRRLADLAQHTQVVVITHLAQVAAFADRHLVVTKHTDSDVTASDIEHVQGERREAELARMLSGEQDSATARRHAADLLSRPYVRR